jgi:hypothetical protein
LFDGRPNKEKGEDLAQFLAAVKAITATGTVHARIRWWFRGQRKIQSLNPSVFREDFRGPTEPPDETQEQRRLRTERHLFREFNDYASSLVDPRVSEHEMYFIQRHYGVPSRLLDWSLDPLVALYFATESKGDEKDTKAGCVFVVDAYKIVGCQKAYKDLPEDDPKKKFRGIGTLKHSGVKAAFETIAWEREDGMPPFHFPVQVAKREVRIINQAGCFTFHVKAALPYPGKVFNEHVIEKPAGAKQGIGEDLKILQFHPFRVYGDLSNLSKTVTERVMGK